MHGIVFNAGTVAVFPQGFQIKAGPLFQPLCFQQFVIVFEELQPFFQFRFNRITGPYHLIMGARIAACREYVVELIGILGMPGQRVNLRNAFDLIAEHLDPDIELIGIARCHIDDITSYPDRSSCLIRIVPAVLQIDEFP